MEWPDDDYDSDKLEDLSNRGFELLDANEGDFTALPKPVATLLRVQGAQGIIDNGGYRYFFEKNWEGTPPYSAFIEAYEEIGCHAQAADLARVVATFPFEQPHLHEQLRNRFIEEFFDEKSYCVLPWGEALCGDRTVWQKLEAYADRHSSEFRARTEHIRRKRQRLIRTRPSPKNEFLARISPQDVDHTKEPG